MKHAKVTLYTDGSFRGRIRAAGYACFLTDEYGRYMLVADGIMNSTISRMELSGIAAGLSYIHEGSDVTIVSDSQYAVSIINKWLSMWERYSYIKANGEPVANQDILSLIAWQIRRMHNVTAVWTKAHTGRQDERSLGNNVCDYAAVKAAENAFRETYPTVYLSPVVEGYVPDKRHKRSH